MKKYTTKSKNIFEKKGDGAKKSHFGNKWKSEKKLPRPFFVAFGKNVIFIRKNTRIL